MFKYQIKHTLKSPAVLLATWFGTGYMRPASGTWGSLAALPFAWLISDIGGQLGLFIASLVAFVVGIWAANGYEKLSGEKDASPIVIDEVAGMWLTLAFVPLDPLLFLVGFFFFRLFDVTKPYPANECEKIKGGLGVMLDDMVAGIYAGLGLSLVAKEMGFSVLF